MRISALRVLALPVLLFTVTGADAALVKFVVPDSTSHIVDWQNWRGPGPAPTSFELTFVLDTSSVTSSNITFAGDPAGEMIHYDFIGTGVLSVSFIVNGVDLWNDPTGMGFSLYADFAGSPAGGGYCFCSLGIGNASQEFAIIYTAMGIPGSQLGGDPLAAILLSYGPSLQGQNVFGSGTWTFLGDGPATVSEIPIPPAVLLFGSALGVMGVMRRKAAA